MTITKAAIEAADLTRPIIGIENRTAQEVFDIMCDRIRLSKPIAYAWIENGKVVKNIAYPVSGGMATTPLYLAPPAPALPEGWQGNLATAAQEVSLWLKASLECGAWHWDGDQFDAATWSLNRLNEALAAAPEPPANAADPVKAQLVEALTEIVATDDVFSGDQHAVCVEIARAALAAAEEAANG